MFRIIVALGLSGFVATTPTKCLADEVETPRYPEIPQSIEPIQDPGPQGPLCFTRITADLVMQFIAGSIHNYIGHAVTSTIWDAQQPDHRQWLYDRLGGPKSGFSICMTKCVVVPTDKNVTYRTCYSETGDDGAQCFGGDGNGDEFAVVNTSMAQRGDALLLCATGKNWSRNRNRRFWIHAEW
jgi:hypothetical protein